MTQLIRSLRGLAPLALVLCFGGGCDTGGPEIARVAGRVTMDGKPLANATVVFIPENGRPAGGRTNNNGAYVLNFAGGRKGAIPGTSQIRITTLREAEQDEQGKVINPASSETIPARYNTATALSFTVEPKKKNIANFELQSTAAAARKN